jgi:hypothetical protein
MDASARRRLDTRDGLTDPICAPPVQETGTARAQIGQWDGGGADRQGHQWVVPGAPLNGPVTLAVTQPP